DFANWELIGKMAEHASGDLAKVMKAKYEEVSEEEAEHLFHTMGWARELWLDSLGVPAALPPPEEEKSVKTQIGAARAEQQRDEYLWISAAGRHPRSDLLDGTGVEHPVDGDPAALGPADTVIHPDQLAGVMGVGVDDHIDAGRHRPPRHLVRGVETVQCAVDLESHAGRGQTLEDGVHVELDPGASTHVSPREVTDGVDGGVGQC